MPYDNKMKEAAMKSVAGYKRPNVPKAKKMPKSGGPYKAGKGKSISELKESTKGKRDYLTYYKKHGKNSMTYGQYVKSKEATDTGGGAGHKKSMAYQARRSPQLMADIMKMKDKKRKGN